MSQEFFIVIAAAALFTAFVLGWLASWFALGVDAAPAAVQPVDDRELRESQELARRHRAALEEAMIEIEELRAYIDRRIPPRPDA